MARADLMDFDEALRRYEPVLGFEVHVELGTATKMFSDAPNAFGGAPNTNVTPVDLGLPGSLPVVNEQAVTYSISLGLALGCSIAESSRFARKNYFYPDNPKNYQISQFDEPIAFEGSVEVELADGTLFTVPIERAHMEEDAGKLTHVGGSTGRIQGADHSLVDYNRAGIPLVEIVTKPIFGAGHRAPELGAAYVSTIRDIVRALGVSEARMERGNLRCDANVSLRPWGQEALGTRTETKNVNSFRSVERAVRHEIQRQAAVLAAGASPQAARKWWTGEIARLANAGGVEPSSLVSPLHVSEIVALVESGDLTDRLARQVLEGVVAGEGSPVEVVEARGLKVVSDDGALVEAIDAALAQQPDVLAKIRDGKVQAAGAVIGAVMKAMKGQADAARVRELVLERAQA